MHKRRRRQHRCTISAVGGAVLTELGGQRTRRTKRSSCASRRAKAYPCGSTSDAYTGRRSRGIRQFSSENALTQYNSHGHARSTASSPPSISMDTKSIVEFIANVSASSSAGVVAFGTAHADVTPDALALALASVRQARQPVSMAVYATLAVGSAALVVSVPSRCSTDRDMLGVGTARCFGSTAAKLVGSASTHTPRHPRTCARKYVFEPWMRSLPTEVDERATLLRSEEDAVATVRPPVL